MSDSCVTPAASPADTSAGPTPSLPATGEERRVRGACPHDCPDTCAWIVTVREGRAVRMQGDPDHPITDGALCAKVAHYPERTYHPDRLLHPLRRTGPKGSGRFERVSWEEALDDIAARWRAIAARDPQAILPYSYAGTMGLVQGEGMAMRFFHRLGASRLDRTICASAGAAALTDTYGNRVGMHVEHFADSRLIVIWGSNSITSNLHFWNVALRAKQRGAKLVCIDPRRTDTAARCDVHLALRPGTDGALALALIHELMAIDGLDHDYLERYTEGWPELAARAQAWTLERAAEVCGLTAAEIRALAHDYATIRPAAIRLNYGMQRVHGGYNAVRLIAILPALVGAWRHRAGGLLLSSSGWFPRNPHLTRPDLLAGREPRTINMSAIGDALLQPASPEFGPAIAALVVYNSNPVAVAPDSTRVVRGFAREDLFTVVLEHFRTDTADYADYVLPATTQLEHWDVHTSYGHTYALLNEPAIAPLGEARPNSAIFRALAARMGFTEPCFAESDEQLIAQAFTREITFERLRAERWVKLAAPVAPFAGGGFPTPSGRCRIAGPGLPAPDYVPNHESPASTPELAARYPLAMISPPARNFLNSSFVNVPSLQAREREPLVEIHPADAAARGVADGAWVRLFNDRGEYHCRARVTTAARPGVVNALGLWWRKLGRNGTNPNVLTSQRLTDAGGGPTFYDCLVDVAPLAGAE